MVSAKSSDCQPKRVGPPLDFSFKDICSMQDALYEDAESGFAKLPALVHVDPENPDEAPEAPKPRTRSKSLHLNTIAVRLGNNKLRSVEGLSAFLAHVMDDPSSLTWLDLSCNELTGIDDLLCQFPNLQVLYLHGNKLNKLSDITKLSRLPKLSKLTLHGNPIAEKPIYKVYTCGHLPKLKSLDFGPITMVDRDMIDGWFRSHQKRLAQR